MSQIIMSTDLTQQKEISTSHPQQTEEFAYRPVPVLACVVFMLGILSGTAFIVDFGVILAFTGGVLGFFALWQQKKNSGAIGGKYLVWTGCVTSVIFFFGGLNTHIQAYQNELPENHIRVNFPRDISMKKLQQDPNGRFLIPKEVAEKYVGKEIFIKGFMWNTSTLTDISSFLFLKDNGTCCMGGNPKPWDVMKVIMKDGQKVDVMRDQLVAISGTLKINPNAGAEDAFYILVATHVEKAKTRY